MARVAELIWKSTDRSVIRDLESMAAQSEKTGHTMKKNASETATVYEHLGKTTIALRERISGLAGVVGLGGLAFGLKDAVEGGLKLQGSQAQLQAALKATGQATSENSKSLREYAEGLSTRGGFGAPENLQALAAFVRETHSARKAQEGLALATNIARARNIDLGSAQQTVQRAYGGSIGRLQALLGPMVAAREAQVGLSVAHQREVALIQQQAQYMRGPYKEAFLRNAEINDHITAQQLALAQITDKNATSQQVIAAAERVFGGSTQAFAGTTQGKLSNFQHSLQNLTDTTGEKLLPAVNMLAKDATVLVNVFGALPAPVQASILGFTALGFLIGPLKQSFGLFKDALGALRGVLMKETIPAVAELGTASEVSAAKEAGSGVGGLGGVGSKAEKASKLSRALRFLGGATAVGTAAYTGIQLLNEYGTPEAKASRITGPTGQQFYNPRVAPFVPHHYATGTGYSAGGPALVGENGPELVNLPSGAQVVPNNQLSQPIVLNVQLRMPNGRVLAEEVIKYSLNRAARGPTSLVGGSLVTGAPGLPA